MINCQCGNITKLDLNFIKKNTYTEEQGPRKNISPKETKVDESDDNLEERSFAYLSIPNSCVGHPFWLITGAQSVNFG